MVEQALHLDRLFHALADSTRRDILSRIAGGELTITELAKPYCLSFAAIAKHISVLERASLIRKRRRGKEQLVSMTPETIQLAEQHLARYCQLWNERFDKLDQILNTQHSETP